MVKEFGSHNHDNVISKFVLYQVVLQRDCAVLKRKTKEKNKIVFFTNIHTGHMILFKKISLFRPFSEENKRKYHICPMCAYFV